MQNKKVFLIINSYYIGDILLANPLVQNIKRIYTDSYVIMLTPPNMVDIAKYQEGVDEVIIWDRQGIHHGWQNMLKFIWNFPYKNIYAAFPIYSGDRAIILSKLLGAKYILGWRRNIIGGLLKSKYKINTRFYGTQGGNVNLLSGITNENLVNYPIKFNLPEVNTENIKKFELKRIKYIALCPTSSKIIKDMSYKDVSYIIEKSNYKIVLLGCGNTADELSKFLKKGHFTNLIDLTNKTSLLEFANIINLSVGCISVDTSALHLACALNKPTVGIFYNNGNLGFKPDSSIYPNTYCGLNLNPSEILDKLNSYL